MQEVSKIIAFYRVALYIGGTPHSGGFRDNDFVIFEFELFVSFSFLR